MESWPTKYCLNSTEIETVRTIVQQSPHHSTNKQSCALPISRISLHSIILDDLGMNLNKMKFAQQLELGEHEKCSTFSETLFIIVGENSFNVGKIMFSDVVYSDLHGNVNKQNV